MTQPPRNQASSGVARLRNRKQKKKASPVKTVLLVGAILGIFFLGARQSAESAELWRRMYSPVAILFAIVLVIEFIVLKGRDRSRIHQIELEQARRKRLEMDEFLRHLEEEIGSLEQLLANRPETDSECNDARQRLSELRRQISLWV